MDNLKPVKSPMDLRSLDRNKDIFRKREDHEPLLGSEVPYLSATGALMFLGTQTRPDIAFFVSLLARHSAQPTIRHWNGIKRIFRYLIGTADLGLYFPATNDGQLTGYADAGYLSDPADAKSQSGYIFMIGPTAFSWKSSKQSLTSTSSNHSELIAMYEASRECIWLRSVISHIFEHTGQPKLTSPTPIFEDNKACIDQLAAGFIKGNRTKHIAPKFFFMHEQLNETITVQWIPSHKNRADLFTKALPPSTHKELTMAIGMRSLFFMQNNLSISQGE